MFFPSRFFLCSRPLFFFSSRFSLRPFSLRLFLFLFFFLFFLFLFVCFSSFFFLLVCFSSFFLLVCFSSFVSLRLFLFVCFSSFRLFVICLFLFSLPPPLCLLYLCYCQSHCHSSCLFFIFPLPLAFPTMPTFPTFPTSPTFPTMPILPTPPTLPIIAYPPPNLSQSLTSVKYCHFFATSLAGMEISQYLCTRFRKNTGGTQERVL